MFDLGRVGLLCVPRDDLYRDREPRYRHSRTYLGKYYRTCFQDTAFLGPCHGPRHSHAIPWKHKGNDRQLW